VRRKRGARSPRHGRIAIDRRNPAPRFRQTGIFYGRLTTRVMADCAELVRNRGFEMRICRPRAFARQLHRAALRISIREERLAIAVGRNQPASGVVVAHTRRVVCHDWTVVDRP
jgi:hypothetical protein